MNIYFESDLDNYDENIEFNPREMDISNFKFNVQVNNITLSFAASMIYMSNSHIIDFCNNVENSEPCELEFNDAQGGTITYNENIVQFHNVNFECGFSVLSVNVQLETQNDELKFKRAVEGLKSFVCRYSEIQEMYYMDHEDDLSDIEDPQ
jgi:hypothetical protein